MLDQIAIDREECLDIFKSLHAAGGGSFSDYAWLLWACKYDGDWFPNKEIKRLFDEFVETEGRSSASMSKSQYVYLLSSGDMHKIGISTEPDKRRRSIEFAVGRPVVLITASAIEDARKVEADLHEKYASKRGIGEWFSLSADDVQDVCQYLSSIGSEVSHV